MMRRICNDIIIRSLSEWTDNDGKRVLLMIYQIESINLTSAEIGQWVHIRYNRSIHSICSHQLRQINLFTSYEMTQSVRHVHIRSNRSINSISCSSNEEAQAIQALLSVHLKWNCSGNSNSSISSIEQNWSRISSSSHQMPILPIWPFQMHMICESWQYERQWKHWQ
jgi:hypothetical protein